MTAPGSPPAFPVFACMHAARAARVPELVPLPCAGRLDVSSLLLGFARGGEGALVVACAGDECRHRASRCECEPSCARAVGIARAALAGAGLSSKRIALRHLAPDAGLDAVVDEHREQLLELGSWQKEEDLAPAAGQGASPVETTLGLVATVQARSSWPGEARGTGEVLLWTGCLDLRRELGGAASPAGDAAELVRRAGAEPVVVSGRCCGEPLLSGGTAGREAFARLARANAELIERTSARQVVTACSHCAEILRGAYEEVGASVDATVSSLAEWAAPRLDLRGAGSAVALARTGDGPAVAEALSPLAMPTIEWPGCDDDVEGPALRSAVSALTRRAAELGASSVLVPCSHCAARAAVLTESAAWQLGPRVRVLDGVGALLRLSAGARGGSEEPDHVA